MKKVFSLSMCLFLVVASIAFCVTREQAGQYIVDYTITNENTYEVLISDSVTVKIDASSHDLATVINTATRKALGFRDTSMTKKTDDGKTVRLTIKDYNKKL